MPTTCLIVDDEPLAIQVLQSHLEPLTDIEIAATCRNALEAFEYLREHSVDLLFLDIQMPQLTGLDFLRALDNPPKVIITTAYRDYAVEGFELDVVDYLLKPIALPRLLKALDKYHTRRRLDRAAPAEAAAEEACFLNVRADHRVVKVPLKEIVFIESLGDYVKIHRTTGKPLVTKERISHLADELAPDGFLRVHRSYLIAEAHVTAFTADEIQLGPHVVPLSRSYKQHVLDRLGYF